MGSTYDATQLSTSSLFRTRFLIGDTSATFEFTDEEVNWVLTEQTNVYLAGARLLSQLRSKLSTKGSGVAEKQVSRLRVKYGFGAGAFEAIDAHIAELRRLGMSKSRVLRTL